MLSAVTSKLSSKSVLTRDSTSSKTLTGTEPVDGKSKRKRPGEFSEPACVAVSPRISRNALCTMCVAVCALEIAWRRSISISARTSLPTSIAPRITLPRCTDKPGTGDCTSPISIIAPLLKVMRPPSANWPPPSA